MIGRMRRMYSHLFVNGELEGTIHITCKDKMYVLNPDDKDLIVTGIFISSYFLMITEKHRCGSPMFETIIPISNVLSIMTEVSGE